MKKKPDKSPKEPRLSVIQTVKNAERQDTANLIKDDDEAQKFISAWRVASPKYVDREFHEGESLEQAWDEIWMGCEYDMVKLAEDAKLPMSVAVREFNRLKHTRLIYPDGSVHRIAAAILTREFQGYLKSLLEQ